MRDKVRNLVLVTCGGIALLDACFYPSAQMFACLLGILGTLTLVFFLAGRNWNRNLLQWKIPAGPVIAVLSLLVSAGLAEAALRILFFERFPAVQGKDYLGYRYDAELGWHPIPNSRRVWQDRPPFIVSHNSEGLRGPELATNLNPNLIFLGDSFVWGFGVDLADRFSEKFQAKHPLWNVYNFGVSGYGTDQEFLLLQQHIAAYKPRLVFLVFCVENDRIDNSSNLREGYYKPYYTTNAAGIALAGVPVPRSERCFCADHRAISQSCLVRLAVRAWYKLKNPVRRENNDPTFAILHEMRKYVLANGSRLAVGLTSSEPDVERFLRQSAIPFVDLSTDRRFAPKDHWTPEGHTIVCNKIDEFLRSEKLLE